jgi:hypothetical protein
VALYELALEHFFMEMPHLKDVCLKQVHEACTNIPFEGSNRPELIRIANCSLLEVLDDNVIEHLRTSEEKKSSSAMFKSLMNYLHRVETILLFIQSSRNADFIWKLEML